jgi:hypothetical protein
MLATILKSPQATQTTIAIIEAFEKYETTENHLNLSVYDLLPIGVKWNYDGQEYEIINGSKIGALLLKNGKNILMITDIHG